MTDYDRLWQIIIDNDWLWQILTDFDRLWQIMTDYDRLRQINTNHDQLSAQFVLVCFGSYSESLKKIRVVWCID